MANCLFFTLFVPETLEKIKPGKVLHSSFYPPLVFVFKNYKEKSNKGS